MLGPLAVNCNLMAENICTSIIKRDKKNKERKKETAIRRVCKRVPDPM